MGHHVVGLFVAGEELSRFESPVIGSMFERSEPMFAMVSAEDGRTGTLRVDIVLDRPLRAAERLPLLEPWSHWGLLAYLAWTERPCETGGWHPLVAAPWRWCRVSRPEPHPSSYPGVRRVVGRAPPEVLPMPKTRRWLYNDTPWPDLDPALAIIRSGDQDFAYLRAFPQHVEQLLLRGQRVEARIVKPGWIGEVYVDLSLVG
jgi:hypothetical protein